VIPTPETEPKLPLSPYGVTKLSGEFYLNYYRQIRGLEYVALRYSNVFGPRQDPHGEAGVVAIFSTRLLKDEPLTIFGDGEQTRDYVFVRDVVSANMTVSDLQLEDGHGLDSRAFNVGTGVGTSVIGLADGLERISGRSPGREHKGERSGELRHSTLETSRLRSRGWAPAFTLEQGLEETYNFIKAQQSAV
jgi:UDP-glucose 4-epimerase